MCGFFICNRFLFSPLSYTEQGKILKVLHTSEDVFIISQYSLFHNEGPVLNMAIDTQKVWVIMLICVVECDFSYICHYKYALGLGLC